MAEFLQDLQNWWPRLLDGLWVTVYITIASMALATVIGLLTALSRMGGPAPLRWVLTAYVEILRGIPVILTLFIIFFGLPAAGVDVLLRQPKLAGVVGLSIALGAYLSEVFRAAILAVDEGQMEAAQSIGMSRRRAYRRIVLPQAFIIAVPTLGNYFIALFKDTALLGFISVVELFRTSVQIVSSTFKPLQVYATIGAMYFLISYVAARLVNWTERRLTPVGGDLDNIDVGPTMVTERVGG
jgi:His/Glu/Gln/Arg/opine family amino acid ABC transporter permease subunit